MALDKTGKEILNRCLGIAKEIKRKATEYPVTDDLHDLPALSIEEKKRFEEAKKNFAELKAYCKMFDINLLEGQTHYGPTMTRCTIPTFQLLRLFKMLEK